MKILVSIFTCLLLSVITVKGQDRNKEDKKRIFSNPNFKKGVSKDSSVFNSYIDSLRINSNKAIAIPNAYPITGNISYTTPIKKLSGKNLAPMPGTENLDKIEGGHMQDSLRIYKPYKK